MKRAVVLLVLAVGGGCLAWFVGYPLWARQLVYPAGNVRTKYPGFGEVVEKAEAKILVSPIGDGAPFFDSAWLQMKYPSAEYDILEMPPQERLLYVVGRVYGWEDISDSNDKYLLVRISGDGKMAKYRISFEGENETLLATEEVGWGLGKTVNSVIKHVPPRLSEVGYTQLKNDVRRGDVVVLTPVFAPPEYAKRDESGNYLALWLVLRRANGFL